MLKNLKKLKIKNNEFQINYLAEKYNRNLPVEYRQVICKNILERMIESSDLSDKSQKSYE